MEIEGYSHCKFYSVVVQRGVGLSFSPLPLLRRKGSHAFVKNFGGTTLTEGERRLLRPLPTASSFPPENSKTGRIPKAASNNKASRERKWQSS